jgi:hypothetical protein
VCGYYCEAKDVRVMGARSATDVSESGEWIRLRRLSHLN